jgi:hypothetical protein
LGKLVRFDPRRPKRLSETVFTDRGSRLIAPETRTASPWFAWAIVLLPLAAFFIVLMY